MSEAIINYNLFSLLSDRNYILTQTDISSDFVISASTANGTPCHIRVIKYQTKLSSPILKSLLKEIKENNPSIWRVIFIFKDKPSQQILKSFEEIESEYSKDKQNVETNLGNQENFIIEYFEESELLYNPTKHIFVPNHRILSIEEKKDVLMKYRAKECDIPKILREDRIARYYGGRKGDMFEIIRKCEGGESLYYRFVEK